MKTIVLRTLFFLVAAITFNAAGAQVRLPSIFSDNMVLQRETAVTIWGWSAPGQKIYVTNSWNNTTDSTRADGGARWALTVNTPAAGGPYTLSVKGGDTITFNNVMIGEVWVCSGQSNMQWSSLNGLVKADSALVASAGNPNIRFLQIPRITSEYPQDDVPASWKECTPETTKGFSAVAYFFGSKLASELNVPIGLINSSWGGTPAEVWTPAGEIAASPELRAAADKQSSNVGRPHLAGSAYNAMIAPFTRYAVAGAIWYQGESNVITAAGYDMLMRTMINSWRKAWNKELPFYYVQIAPFRYGNKYGGALLREAQTKTLGLPKTGMVVVSDLTEDVKDIHPRQKKGVGERLAGLALAETYHRQVSAYKSPQYRDLEIKKDKAIVYFDNVSDGLVLKDNNKNAKATEFYIAGEDRNFLPADVKIENDRVIVSSKQVKNPVAVRFSFSDTGIGNIFSKAGLPVVPFRTDNWEVDTKEKE